jgi:hypothetical protein
MDTDQHHENESTETGAEDTTPSRPDDPAVIAAAAGKTTPEHKSDNAAQQLQPSQQHNRGPPDDDLAGDLLVGREAIRQYLAYLGMPAGADIYYLKRIGWPIGKSGSAKSATLIASKRRLARYAQKITTPQKSDAA